MDGSGLSLICVPTDQVAAFWPSVVDLIATAYETGLGDDDVDSLAADVMSGGTRLWLVWSDGLLAALTTKIVEVPTKRLCVISSLAGAGMSRWLPLISEIEAYARHESCDAVRVSGREGWKRVLTDYRQPWVCLEKDVR